jgi:hypothetical protein
MVMVVVTTGGPDGSLGDLSPHAGDRAATARTATRHADDACLALPAGAIIRRTSA